MRARTRIYLSHQPDTHTHTHTQMSRGEGNTVDVVETIGVFSAKEVNHMSV